ARLEESRGGPIDEYTVARASGLLDTDLPGQDWMLRPEREAIRRLFDELEQQGMLRLDRTGYWRPRTTLAGRRALQTPSGAPRPPPPPRPRPAPPPRRPPARPPRPPGRPPPCSRSPPPPPRATPRRSWSWTTPAARARSSSPPRAASGASR